MANYLYPVEINLSELEFEKLDAKIGSGKMIPAHFMISNAGILTNFIITLNRSTGLCTKNIQNVEFDISGGEFFVSDSSGTPPISSNNIPLLESVTQNLFHTNFHNSSRLPEELISGALYTLMVKEIFDNINTTSIDFSDFETRNNGILFVRDPTAASADSSGIITDIIKKTTIELNNNINSDSSGGSEYDYWNARTGEDASGFETNSVAFNVNDKIFILYSVSVTLSNVVTDGSSLTALTNAGTGDDVSFTPKNIKFVLGWNTIN